MYKTVHVAWFHVCEILKEQEIFTCFAIGSNEVYGLGARMNRKLSNNTCIILNFSIQSVNTLINRFPKSHSHQLHADQTLVWWTRDEDLNYLHRLEQLFTYNKANLYKGRCYIAELCLKPSFPSTRYGTGVVPYHTSRTLEKAALGL